MKYAVPVQSTPSSTALTQECIGIAPCGHEAIANGASNKLAHTSVAEATAPDGMPGNCRRIRLPPMPYRNPAKVPASAALHTLLPPAVLPLASTATPMNPTSRPNARRLLICSLKTTKATSAVHITAVAFVIAPIPAGARCAAQANNEKGIAVLIAETK